LPSCINTSADFAVLALLVNLMALFGNGLESIGFNDGLSSKFATALKPPRHSIKSVREIRLRIKIGARVPLSRTRNVESQLHGAKTNLPQIFLRRNGNAIVNDLTILSRARVAPTS
jgi:hypothetical protein